jgi:hypothetical protein
MRLPGSPGVGVYRLATPKTRLKFILGRSENTMDMHLAGTMKPFILSMLLLLRVTAILVKKMSGAVAR